MNTEHGKGWGYRYQPGMPAPQDDSPVPLTIGGFTDEQRQQLRRSAPTMNSADEIYAGLCGLAKIQGEHNREVFDKAIRQPALYSEERVRAAIHGQEPDSQEAQLMSAMKKAVDAADEAAEAPVVEGQNRVDEIRNGLVTPGDSAQEQRNTRSRDRVLRRLSTAKTNADRVNIARTALEQAQDRSEFGTLLTELPSELAAEGVDADTINRVIEPVVRQRIPELAAAQDDLSDKRFKATISHHTAGVVRRGLASGVPANKLVLNKLDPAKIQKPQGFR